MYVINKVREAVLYVLKPAMQNFHEVKPLKGFLPLEKKNSP